MSIPAQVTRFNEHAVSNQTRKPSLSLPPITIPGYELLRQIGEGGYGTIFLAKQLRLDRLVALKVLRRLSSVHKTELEFFRREGKHFALQNRQANIIEIWDSNIIHGIAYYTMPYMANGTLADYATDDLRISSDIVHILLKILRALHSLHQLGILHRDLKPNNILMDHNNEPYLADFDVARWTSCNDDFPVERYRIGTTAYLAPEILKQGPIQFSVTSEVWALGVILYECLGGQMPFGASSEDQLCQRICFEPPIPLLSLQTCLSGTDEDLEKIVDRCLAKDPYRRYANVKHLADDLERWLNGASIVGPTATELQQASQGTEDQHDGTLFELTGPNHNTWPSLLRVFFLTLIAFLFGFVSLLPNNAISRANADNIRLHESLTHDDCLTRWGKLNLLGETGLPLAPYEILLSSDASAELNAQDHFTVESTGAVLVNLNDEQLSPPYRIHATMSQADPNTDGWIGLWVAGQVHPQWHFEEPTHSYTGSLIKFQQNPHTGQISSVFSSMAMDLESYSYSLLCEGPHQKRLTVFPPDDFQPNTTSWVNVSADVHQKYVEASIQGQRFPIRLGRVKTGKVIKKILKNYRINVQPRLYGSQLSLFIHGNRGYFKSVWIEKLYP